MRYLFFLVCFWAMPAVCETTSFKVVHPSWHDTLVEKSSDIFCRQTVNDCARLTRKSKDKITLKWDKWGEETFYLSDETYFLDHAQTTIEEEYAQLDYTFFEPYVKVNPYGTAPLTALVRFKTEKPARLSWTVKGINGATDVTNRGKTFETEHTLTVFMLYPGIKNKVILTADFKDGTTEKSTVSIKTDKIKNKKLIVPLIRKGTTPYYYYTFDGDILDEQGFIRYAFPSGHIIYLVGNEFIIENRGRGLTRYALSGKLLQFYPYPQGFLSFEHGIGITPQGNFLVPGSLNGTKAMIESKPQETHRDIILEIHKKTGEIVKKWDLARVMNPDRSVIVKSSERDFGKIDWCHMNSIQYDISDNSLVLSCRHTGMVKIDYQTGALKWLFGPNIGYEKSGRNGKGPAISDKVLTAVTGGGGILPPKVQSGYEKHPAFKWPTKTHDAKVIGKGLYSIFDNSGDIYNKSIVSTPDSHASIFKINPEKKTVEHIWHVPLQAYSPVGSGVTYDKKTDSVTVFLSQVKDKNTDLEIGRLIRYDFKTKDKLFEAVIHTPYWIYRAEPINIDTLLQ